MNKLLLSYPKFLAEALQADPKIRAAIDSAISTVADVLQISKLPFFPDYTDHGPKHLSSVLDIADKLIADVARQIFTAADAAALTFAVLLHDLALHLSEAGFITLLNRKHDPSHTTQWTDLWQEFMAVAKHWDDRKLVELFGADEAGAPLALVRDPLDHYNNLAESDRKLIGEFIRQHHAQMAYEFSVSGFPGTDGHLIEFGLFDSDMKQLVGIIARSHGFPLRDCVRQLEEKQFNKLEHDDVHPVYLMGILRVADFLELGSDRAPMIAFAYKEFKSYVSQKEWRTNQAFRKISWGNPDPESINIPAKPTDVYSFLELQKWLRAIQSELDVTWAVLGEIYGAHPKFSQLGLSIRRVHSNITDDPAAYAKNAPFVPRRIELGVAGADVLKLFIEPLYGSHPEIGIRELIQNAVDAVRERWEYAKNHPQFAPAKSEPQQPDVLVWLDDPDENGVALLTVTDQGIGMTEDIVANYFLKAGASFRRSIAWKKEFESETIAEKKKQLKSRVLRSGRFGIGVFAAFLLGDEIEVSTRHITSHRGIRFSVRLDLRPPALEINPIQLNYDEDLPVGTTVKIKVTKVKRAPVEQRRRYTVILGTDIFRDPHLWDWYCLASPSVLRVQGPEKRPLTQGATVPSEDAPLKHGWHSLLSFDYRAVHVLVNGVPSDYAPDLTCNGIKVRQAPGQLFAGENATTIDWKTNLYRSQGLFRLRAPKFSIFDTNGNLPLNLQRTGLTNLNVDFVREAFAAQAKAALAAMTLLAPAEPKFPEEFSAVLRDLFEFDHTIPVFFTRNGTALLTATNLTLAHARNCLLLNIEEFTQGWPTQLHARYDAIIVARPGRGDTSPIYSLNEINAWIACARVISRSQEAPTVAKPLRFRYKEFSANDLHVYRTANCSPTLLKQEEIKTLSDQLSTAEHRPKFRAEDDLVAAELFLKDQLPSGLPPEFSLGHYWKEIIAQPVIPFDLTNRRQELSHVYVDLREYLEDLAEQT